MKKTLLALVLTLSNLITHGLTITSDVSQVVGRGFIGNRQFEASITGTAMAIWTESSFSTQVQAAYFNGSIWFPVITIADGAFPQVGVASNGISHAVWLNTLNTSSTQIFASRFSPASNSWSTPIQISNSGVNSAPQIAVNSQGNALAIWIQNYPPSIQAATYNASTSMWTGPFILISRSGNVILPDVTLDDSNNGVVLWTGATGAIDAITVSVP